jgi:uncharacterized protein (TIGR02145 family)
MKNIIFTLPLCFVMSIIIAQPGTITNIQVAQGEGENERLVSIQFDLTGDKPSYDITLEVSFDDGDTFAPVYAAEVTGETIVAPGIGIQLIWDGRIGYPAQYIAMARIKIIATYIINCGDQITDIDGNIYNTVLIGEQCWMKENLNTTRDAAGNFITRYCFDNNTTNCDLYGGFYTWNTVMNGAVSSSSNQSGVQGICPEGWHMPSEAEWMQLVDYVATQGFPNSNVTNGAGNALKSCRQVNSPLDGDCNTSEHPRWNSDGTHHGFNEFGFSAFPGGYRGANGTFANTGLFGFWWSSTEISSDRALGPYTTSSNGKVGPNNSNKTLGLNTRCLRDN